MRRFVTLLAVLLLSLSGAAACAHPAPAMAADVQNAGHDADCPGNSTGGDMAAVADALCDCAQPAFVDAVAKPLPVALAAAPIVWTAPPLAYSGADFTRTPSFHGPPRLYLLTGRLRI